VTLRAGQKQQWDFFTRPEENFHWFLFTSPYDGWNLEM